jgi:hypothetical protein
MPGSNAPPGGDDKPAAPSRDSFVPLGSIASGERGGPGREGMPGVPPDRRPGGNGGAPAANYKGAQHVRTDFLILFIWKEPTPSDALRGVADGGNETPAGGGSPTPTPPR